MTLLKHVADVRVSNVDKKSHEGERPVRLCNYTDVYYGDVLTAQSNDYMAATASTEQVRSFRLQPGDTVLTKDSETADDIGVSAFIGDSADDLVCGYHLAIVRPRKDLVDPKYLSWYLRSTAARGQLSTAATGVTRFGLRTDVLTNMTLALPDYLEQKRITDFLDAQIILIDRLLALKREQVRLTNQWSRRRWSDRILESQAQPWAPLRRFLISIVDGPFGSSLTSSHYVNSGARVVRLGNIGSATFRDSDAVYISKEYYEDLKQHSVRAGDLLVAGLGDDSHPLGRSCVAPDGLGLAIVKADCYRLRLDSARINHKWAAIALTSPPVLAMTRTLSRGSTRARINTEIAREITLPVPEIQVQERLIANHEADLKAVEKIRQLVGDSEVLLNKRKQALITAAVTGQLDVTTARSGLSVEVP